MTTINNDSWNILKLFVVDDFLLRTSPFLYHFYGHSGLIFSSTLYAISVSGFFFIVDFLDLLFPYFGDLFILASFILQELLLCVWWIFIVSLQYLSLFLKYFLSLFLLLKIFFSPSIYFNVLVDGFIHSFVLCISV